MSGNTFWKNFLRLLDCSPTRTTFNFIAFAKTRSSVSKPSRPPSKIISLSSQSSDASSFKSNTRSDAPPGAMLSFFSANIFAEPESRTLPVWGRLPEFSTLRNTWTRPSRVRRLEKRVMPTFSQGWPTAAQCTDGPAEAAASGVSESVMKKTASCRSAVGMTTFSRSSSPEPASCPGSVAVSNC